MTVPRTPITAVILGAGLVAVAGAPLVGQANAPAAGWVPLVADYEESGPSGTVRGRLWRGADGSIRLETGDGLVAPHIRIRNIARGIAYEFRALWGWTSRPLGARTAPGMAADDVGADAAAVIFEGRAALRRISPDGGVDVTVPELNSLTVERTLPDGPKVALRNVRTGVAPDAALFDPPAGAAVRWLGPGQPPGPHREYRGDDPRDLPGRR